jgi:Bifunctional DNA primase/polymerase, N-terminal
VTRNSSSTTPAPTHGAPGHARVQDTPAQDKAPQDRAGLPLLREAALAAARAGCHVFPVLPNTKVPALHGARRCRGRGICRDGHQGWEQRAARDPAQIRRWWAMPFNIGIACGPSGLVVIDLDDAHGDTPPPEWAGASGGVDVLARLAAAGGHELGDTMTVTTPTGGLHRYYRAPAGSTLRNSAGMLGWRVDVRAHGGFIVGPGSIRPEGRYQVLRPGPPAPLPYWLGEQLTRLARSPLPQPIPTASLGLPAGRVGAYLSAILDRETDTVRTAAQGQRRASLLAAARTLGRLVGGGELGYHDARNTLLAAAGVHIGTAGFTTTEAETTIDDALAYGMRMPRHLRDTTTSSNEVAGPDRGTR